MAIARDILIDSRRDVTSVKLKLAKTREQEQGSVTIDPEDPQDLEDRIPGTQIATREVPVNVTRRTNRVLPPEPPPKNRSVAQRKQKNDRSCGRRKGGIGPGGDGDSDSDSDERNRREVKVEQANRTKKGANIIDIHPFDTDDSFARSRMIEENERVKQLRELRQVEEKWEDMKEERNNNDEGVRQIKALINVRHLDQSHANTDVHKRLCDYDWRLRDYLDDVLYGVIRENEWESASQILTEKEEIVQWLEMSVLQRCDRLDVWKYSKKPLSERLCLALETREKECWKSRFFALALETRRDYLGSAPWPHSSDPTHEPVKPWAKDIEWAVKEYIGTVSSKLELFRKPRFIDELADSLWTKIVSKMAEVAVSATLLSIPDGKWLQDFDQSRENGRLKASYVDWVIGDADPERLEQLCREWHKEKRGSRLAQYRRSMGSVKLTIDQVFCPGILRNGEVSLLLLKGGFPTGIRTVSPNELKNLGWFHDHEKKSFDYWRCEPINKERTGPWLKVNMDGKVLGVFCLEDRGYALQCTENSDGCVLRQRPLSPSERSAIFGHL